VPSASGCFVSGELGWVNTKTALIIVLVVPVPLTAEVRRLDKKAASKEYHKFQNCAVSIPLAVYERSTTLYLITRGGRGKSHLAVVMPDDALASFERHATTLVKKMIASSGIPNCCFVR
jgi:hypothetical protein